MTDTPSQIVVEPRPPFRWVRRFWPSMDAPQFPRDRISTCYHEIGHIIVGSAYGSTPIGVVVRRDNSGSAYQGSGPPDPDFHPDLDEHGPPLPLDGMLGLMPTKIALCHQLMLREAEFQPFDATVMHEAGLAVASGYFAGTMAEMLLHGHKLSGPFDMPGCSDFDFAHMALSITFGGGGIGAFYAMATARAILTERWKTVQRLADALNELSYLHGDDIQSVLDGRLDG